MEEADEAPDVLMGSGLCVLRSFRFLFLSSNIRLLPHAVTTLPAVGGYPSGLYCVPEST